MNKIILALVLLTSYSACAQNRSSAKKSDFINKTIGTWEFIPGDMDAVGHKGREQIYFESFHVARIEFLPNNDFIFLLSDSTKQIGKWDISDNLRKLILTNRKDIPKKYDSLPDLRFRIRNKDQFLLITYEIHTQDLGDILADIKYHRIKK